MKSFKTWLENQESDHNKELQNIWADTFKALGVGGLSDEDAAQQSLSKITFNQRSSNNPNSPFKGKQAVRKRLENGQIFARLSKTGNPDVNKNVEDVRKWLDTKDSEHSANASTTISNLLQKLFGQETFEKFIDSKFPKADQAKAKVEPMPPKQDVTGLESPAPDNSMTQAPESAPQAVDASMGQPQANPAMLPPNPQNSMPPKPAGAEQGMF
jgi:hypothetical protein